jgi:hypothetical protein
MTFSLMICWVCSPLCLRNRLAGGFLRIDIIARHSEWNCALRFVVLALGLLKSTSAAIVGCESVGVDWESQVRIGSSK